MTSRELLQVVEIDVDRCTLNYGVGACAAALGVTGQKKCFNSFKTCQDTDNFDKGVLTLRFCKNQDGAPRGKTVFPALQKVSTNATVLNIAGIESGTGALGRREKVTISLQDFTYSDELTDPYRAGRADGTAQIGNAYNPEDFGTFFGKMRARNPFYYGRALRVKNGYVGDDIATMRTQHYIIDEWNGPNASGAVTVIAKDILNLADNEKAVCPAQSDGKLAADIEAGLVSFDLVPVGIGASYPASGFASIGNEIMAFDRAGDVITLTERGAYGSSETTHSQNDTFQNCYTIEGALISEAVSELLTDFAGIDPSYIDQSAWDTETTRWLNGLEISTVIPKPTGVLTLLAELAQLGLSLWWDSVNQKIEYRLNRLTDINDNFANLSDADNLLEGSAQVVDKPDSRISQAVLYHGPIDYTASMTRADNFSKASAVVDLESEGPNQYDQSLYKTMFSRWIGAGSDAAALSVARRAVLRYRDIPSNVTFTVDVKDLGDVGLAGLLTLQTRLLQDDTGQATPTEMQILEYEETVPGHRVRVVAQTFAFAGLYGFITGNGRSDYDTATDEEKRQGTYIAPDTGLFSDGRGAYQLF